jgi:hypothetical protein
MSLDAAVNYIETMDLSPIKNKMINGLGWRKREVEQASMLYRNYLLLRLKYPNEQLPPSEDVDEFWHNHILDTKKYREDCQAIGCFFEHYPYFGMDAHSTREDLNRAFEKMQELHVLEFGYRVPRIRYPTLVGWMLHLLGLATLVPNHENPKSGM